MPTVAEIIQDVDERMPNRFSVETKIRWINSFQRRIFRKLDIPAVYSFKTQANVAIYPLPESCDIDLIEEVVYDDVHIPYKSLQEEAVGTFYYSVAGQIGIYPTPTEANKLVTIFYKKRPKKLSVDNIDEEIPELHEDYHELIKLYLFITIAKSREDAELANAYTYDFNELLMDLQMDLIEKEPEYPGTQDVMKGTSSTEEVEW